jgi:hypothetical protein
MPLRCATAIIHPDSRDLDGRISGSLAAFKFAIWARFKKLRSDSFWKDFATHPILLFQKMRGWLRLWRCLANNDPAVALPQCSQKPPVGLQSQ